MPVRVGGESELDACATIGRVAGLRRDGFLAVRAGPGTRSPMLDRLLADRTVWLCEERGEWLGVVYATDGKADCGVASPQPRRAAYRGPCRSGWVSGRYVKPIAG